MSLRIVIVEDEDCIRSLFREICEIGGHEVVHEAKNGKEAMEKLRSMKPPPDAVIVDHRMPLKDGLTVTQELKALNAGIDVIFASADAKIRAQAMQAGANSFITKPFRVNQLLRALKRILPDTENGDAAVEFLDGSPRKRAGSAEGDVAGKRKVDPIPRRALSQDRSTLAE